MVNSRDWIDCIVEETWENYTGRKIVLWGKYGASDRIKKELKKRYGVEIAFYIDKDSTKIDNRNVFSTSCLQGRSKEYYVVVPVGYYQSLKEELIQGGYSKEKDYSYFCDCITSQTSDYYEDTHGNKVLGAYSNCKFVFSGFNSTVKIEKSAIVNKCEFHIHNDSQIEIGENVEIQNSEFFLKNDIRMEIGNGCEIRGCRFSMHDNSKCQMGYNGNVIKQNWCLNKCAVLNISDNFTTGGDGHWMIGPETSVLIGEDCMFSRGIFLRSYDAHSIFDVRTGANINSIKEICRNRKIIIGNHVWIGERAFILYNTEIADGSIIGVGSLVKGKIPNNCIVAGVPARVIRKDIVWSREDGADELMECEKKYARLTE